MSKLKKIKLDGRTVKLDYAKDGAAADAAAHAHAQGLVAGHNPKATKVAKAAKTDGAAAVGGPKGKHAGRLVLHNLPFTVRLAGLITRKLRRGHVAHAAIPSASGDVPGVDHGGGPARAVWSVRRGGRRKDPYQGGRQRPHAHARLWLCRVCRPGRCRQGAPQRRLSVLMRGQKI